MVNLKPLAALIIAVLKAVFNFMFFTPPSPGGPGGGGARNKIKKRFKHSQVLVPAEDALITKLYWADLEGPRIYHVSFYLFAVGPKNTKCPRMGLINGLRG